MAASSKLIGSIDQGTTSTRFIVFDDRGSIVSMAQEEHKQYHPEDGQVEHDAEEIWERTCNVITAALKKVGLEASALSAVGITNQRETVVAWDRKTGKALRRAIVWQDTRGRSICKRLASELGGVDALRERTGLPLDPYFSGSKVRWMLEEDEAVQRALREGTLCIGTIDTFLLWRLTGGSAFVTDVTNASRTLMMDLHTLDWAPDLLPHFGLPADAADKGILPRVRPSSEVYGEGSSDGPLPGVPLAGVLGDQQAALFGQACFQTGQTKFTFGTGCFALRNTGGRIQSSKHKLLTTVAYQLTDPATGKPRAPVFALEGSVAQAGSVVQWLRDGLQLIKSAKDIEGLAGSVDSSNGAVLVPAFTGLFAPYWDSTARGVLVGMTGDTRRAHVARAVLDAVVLQAAELDSCLEQDHQDDEEAAEGEEGAEGEVRVDGGMVANDLFLQLLADATGRRIVRPQVIETTALGAAYAAGLAVGVWSGLEDLSAQWEAETTVEGRQSKEERAQVMHRWRRAVQRSRGWLQDDKAPAEEHEVSSSSTRAVVVAATVAAVLGVCVGWALASQRT